MSDIEQIENILHRINDKLFSCTWVKQDGTTTTRVLRLKARKKVKGVGASWDPKPSNRKFVWSVTDKGFRTIDLNTIQSLKCGDINYTRKDNS